MQLEHLEVHGSGIQVHGSRILSLLAKKLIILHYLTRPAAHVCILQVLLIDHCGQITPKHSSLKEKIQMYVVSQFLRVRSPGVAELVDLVRASHEAAVQTAWAVISSEDLTMKDLFLSSCSCWQHSV